MDRGSNYILWTDQWQVAHRGRVDEQELGRRIRARRVAAGLSQEQLAERASVTSVYVSMIERGRANVSIRIMNRLAAALGTTLRGLICCDLPTDTP